MVKTSTAITSACARRAEALFARAGVKKSSSPLQSGLFIRFARAGKSLKNHATMVRALHREPDSPDSDLNFKHYAAPIKELLLKKLGGITSGEGVKAPHLVMSCPTFKDSSPMKKNEGAIIDVHWLYGKPADGANTTSMFGFRLLFVDSGIFALELLKGRDLVPVVLETTQYGRDARQKDEKRCVVQAKFGTGITALVNHGRAAVAPCIPLPLKLERTDTILIQKELERTLSIVPSPPEPERACSLALKMDGLTVVDGLPTMPPPSLEPPPLMRC